MTEELMYPSSAIADICKREREKVLDEAITHWENVIEYGKGVSYNHSVTYEWMYRGVVNYLKELREGKDGEP